MFVAMKFETLFSPGDRVFMTIGEQMEGLIASIEITPAGKHYGVRYEVNLENGATKYLYEFEIQSERNLTENDRDK